MARFPSSAQRPVGLKTSALRATAGGHSCAWGHPLLTWLHGVPSFWADVMFLCCHFQDQGARAAADGVVRQRLPTALLVADGWVPAVLSSLGAVGGSGGSQLPASWVCRLLCCGALGCTALPTKGSGPQNL